MATFVVTGCSRGLGLELVKQLSTASSFSKVFATTRGTTPSSALADIIGASDGRVSHVKLDVDDASSIKHAAKDIEEQLAGKGVDVLVNNAAAAVWEADGITDALESLLKTNVVGVQKVTAAFLPLLHRGSQKKIVNITSGLGSIALAHAFTFAPTASYKISKTALNMLTAQYALQLEKDGFIVFAISPGWLKTDLGGDGADLSPEQGAKATLDVIFSVTKEDNGAFRNIHIPGNDSYDGKYFPW